MLINKEMKKIIKLIYFLLSKSSFCFKICKQKYLYKIS